MILQEAMINFKEIERTVQKICFEIGREMLSSVLEEWDRYLMHSRAKDVYRHIGTKKTTIKTVLGEVTYGRVQYEYIDDDGMKCFVFLLDEAMGIGSGQISDLLSEIIIQACLTNSYREAARQVSETTGQTISHTTAWQQVQTVGKQVDQQEERASELAAKGAGAGTIEAKVLFEEQDGVMLPLQGKSRKEHGPSKEMKLSVAYDGAEKTGKKRYILTNKVASASFEGAEEFAKRKEGVIAGVYNVDEIMMRFLNGDGATWIKRSLEDDTVHFQLDPYHRNRAITKYVPDPDTRKLITETLYSKDIDLLLHVIEVEALSADEEDVRDDYMKLHSYFQNNRDGLIPYHRRGLDIPDPPDGKVYRRMGAAESNIFTIIGNRMKGRRHSWSVDGGNNLARLLCLKHTGRLRGILDNLSATVLPERYAEEVTVEMSAAKVPLREGKGYNGFRQARIPSSLGWLKDLASIKPLPGSWKGGN